MLKSIEYNKLAELGLTVWQPRPFRHSELQPQQTLLDPQPLRINARCAVVLYVPNLQPMQLAANEQKILTGMLSVLNLPAEQIMQITIYSAAPNLKLIIDTLQQWCAQSVLQLSMELPLLAVANCFRTYSPTQLAQDAQHKPTAYKELLKLRECLHGS